MFFQFSRGEQWKFIHTIFMLILFYTNVVVTFAVIYICLDITDLGPVVDHYESRTLEDNKYWMDRVATALYFSVLTLFSVVLPRTRIFCWLHLWVVDGLPIL